MDDQHAADAIASSVRRIFSEVLGRENLPPNASLDAIGLDSMAMIEVSVRIEETLRIEMPDLGCSSAIAISRGPSAAGVTARRPRTSCPRPWAIAGC